VIVGSVKRFVFAEIRDGQAEGIYGNEFVRDVELENEHEVGRVKCALQLAAVGGRVVDNIEVRACLLRRVLHPFEGDVLYPDIDPVVKGPSGSSHLARPLAEETQF
jgi:hypothetical protein